MSADAKPLTTAEVLSWGPYAPSNPRTTKEILRRLLATTLALEAAMADAEFERMRLAACGVGAMSNTEKTRAKRLPHGHMYSSGSYEDVCRLADAEMSARARAEKAEAKAQQYETDWRAAKTEFGDAAAKLRRRAESAERERDATAVRLGIECANVLAARTERDEALRRLELVEANLREDRARVAELETALRGIIEHEEQSTFSIPSSTPGYHAVMAAARAAMTPKGGGQ